MDAPSGHAQTSSCRSCAGFTLLELLVVLVILGILTAIVPSALAGLPSVRLRAAASEFGEALRQAHDDAIRTGRTVDISIDTRRRSYAATGQGPIMLPAVVDVMTATRDGPGAQGKDLHFRFFADGSATGGTITLRHGQRRAVVRIQWLTGRVQIDD